MKFRKKPVVIEAVQFIGGRESADEVLAFMEHRGCWHHNHGTIAIPTLEGTMHAGPGDWIIRGIKGEFYPCKPGIFAATYEAVDEVTYPCTSSTEDVSECKE